MAEYVHELWRRPKRATENDFVLRWERADYNIYASPEAAKKKVEQYENVVWLAPPELLDGSSDDYDYRIQAQRVKGL